MASTPLFSVGGLSSGLDTTSIIEQLMKVKDSYNCDALSIAGATAAIDDQAWLRENRAKLLRTLDVGGPTFAAPTVVGGRVYATSWSGKLYAFRAR